MYIQNCIQDWQIRKRQKMKAKKKKDKTKNNHGVFGWLLGKLLESQ